MSRAWADQRLAVERAQQIYNALGLDSKMVTMTKEWELFYKSLEAEAEKIFSEVREGSVAAE